MPNITTERLEKILDEKLNPLSEQLKEALATVKTLNTKIEQMEDTFGMLQEENKALKQEQVSLKAQVLRSANDLKLVQNSLVTKRSTLEETVLKSVVFLFQRIRGWKILTTLCFS